jgi:hypothetical protein
MGRVVLLFGLLVLSGCGDGDFDLHREGPDASLVDLRGEQDDETEDTAAKTFFVNNLFPLMRTNGTSWQSDASVKGCAGSGCHAVNSATPRFFQQDSSDTELSWNYARVRRNIILVGDFASEPPASRTLRSRNLNSSGQPLPQNQRHQSFRNWSNEEMNLINDWTNLD